MGAGLLLRPVLIMPKRVFRITWTWRAPDGEQLRFRRHQSYDVPAGCAHYADQHGITLARSTKAIGAADENKMLDGAPENKRVGSRKKTT